MYIDIELTPKQIISIDLNKTRVKTFSDLLDYVQTVVPDIIPIKFFRFIDIDNNENITDYIISNNMSNDVIKVYLTYVSKINTFYDYIATVEKDINVINLIKYRPYKIVSTPASGLDPTMYQLNWLIMPDEDKARVNAYFASKNMAIDIAITAKRREFMNTVIFYNVLELTNLASILNMTKDDLIKLCRNVVVKPSDMNYIYIMFDIHSEKTLKEYQKIIPISLSRKYCQYLDIMNVYSNSCIASPKSKTKQVTGSRISPTRKTCDKNKILNPKTNRCVLRDGAIGKRILKTEETSPKTKQATGNRISPARKTCDKNKILNPKTNRCVLRDGDIGKRIFKS